MGYGLPITNTNVVGAQPTITASYSPVYSSGTFGGAGGGGGLSAAGFSPTGNITQRGLAVEGDITINGVSLTDTLDRIERRLGILHPNEELEEIWTELKELGNRYRELVKNIPEEILEKKSVWDLLKK